MIRIITAVIFGLTVALLIAAIACFFTGWWIIGILAVLGSVVAGMFTLAGMSLIVLVEFDV